MEAYVGPLRYSCPHPRAGLNALSCVLLALTHTLPKVLSVLVSNFLPSFLAILSPRYPSTHHHTSPRPPTLRIQSIKSDQLTIPIKDTFECKAFITPPYPRTAVVKLPQTKTLEVSGLLSRSSRPSLMKSVGQ